MIPRDELLSNLAQFTSITQWHKHKSQKFVYSEGVQYLAEAAEAYWLVDVIASHQTPKILIDPLLKVFQIWKLKLTKHEPHKEAVITCKRDTGHIAVTHHIDCTNFPLDEIELFLESGFLMFQSERWHWYGDEVDEEIEFESNKDEHERDQIIAQAYSDPLGKSIRRFSELSLDKLQQLVDKKFADLQENKNISPTIAELLEFGKFAVSEGYTVTFDGYTVILQSCDYKVIIDAISIRPQTNVGNYLAEKFSPFGETAKEFALNSELLRAWWD